MLVRQMEHAGEMWFIRVDLERALYASFKGCNRYGTNLVIGKDSVEIPVLTAGGVQNHTLISSEAVFKTLLISKSPNVAKVKADILQSLVKDRYQGGGDLKSLDALIEDINYLALTRETDYVFLQRLQKTYVDGVSRALPENLAMQLIDKSFEIINTAVCNPYAIRPKTYVMFNPETELYKIGRTSGPVVDSRERAVRLKTGKHVRTIMEFDGDKERYLHDMFSKTRVTGEWFRLTETDLEVLYGMDGHRFSEII
jgi:hypothetical protein